MKIKTLLYVVDDLRMRRWHTKRMPPLIRSCDSSSNFRESRTTRMYQHEENDTGRCSLYESAVKRNTKNQAKQDEYETRETQNNDSKMKDEDHDTE